MIVLIYNEKDIITNIYSVNNAKSEFLTGLSYKIFDQTDAYKGLNIRAVNDEGSIKTRIEQIELGLDFLKDNEEIVNGEIVEKEAETEPPTPEDAKDQEIRQIDSQLEKVKETMIKLLAEEKLLGFVNEDLENRLKTQYQELLVKRSLHTL
ncbi:MAG: hypothetical protein ACRCS8_02100 [Brevinema sp.]